MSTPPFNILDSKYGDRVLDKAAVQGLLEGDQTSTFSAPPAIGDDTPNTGAFTGLTSETLDVSGAATLELGAKNGTGSLAASATAGAATLNQPSGKITSESITTAAGAVYTLTLTDSEIAVADMVFASVQLGTSTQGTPQIQNTTVTANTAVITVKNIHGTQPFNGTIVISFLVARG